MVSDAILLSQCEEGANIQILKLATDKGQALQIMEQGLYPRAKFSIVRKRSDGALILQGGVRLAMGGVIASKIFVARCTP